MKKLMIAAVIVCAAAFAQAATVSWTNAGTMINGDPTNWDAEDNVFANNGWAVYLFDNKAVARDTMFMADGSLNVDGLAKSLTQTLKTANYGDYDGAISLPNVEMLGDPMGTVEGYAIILDAASIKEASYAYVTDVFSASVGSSGAAEIVVSNYADTSDWYGLLNATSYSSDWTKVGAVPEPTSGLLLLIGVAGLALRRRRA